jgi:hypothetical protein
VTRSRTPGRSRMPRPRSSSRWMIRAPRSGRWHKAPPKRESSGSSSPKVAAPPARPPWRPRVANGLPFWRRATAGGTTSCRFRSRRHVSRMPTWSVAARCRSPGPPGRRRSFHRSVRRTARCATCWPAATPSRDGRTRSCGATCCGRSLRSMHARLRITTSRYGERFRSRARRKGRLALSAASSCGIAWR